jgi:glycosyltransferase involved in cell wall biosynthesis
MISIIIPAYNEESVIERTIRSVQKALVANPGEVIVVCNGCQDSTYERVCRFGDTVRAINLPVGSKTAALNAGDRMAKFFPRFYLDADIEVSENAFSSVACVLQEGRILAAAPEMRCVFANASWPVKAFYQIWLNRPYHTQGHVGSGFVGISQRGRQRFTEFPDIIADDEFLRRQFKSTERQVVQGAWFSIQTPQDVGSLIKVKTRSRLGTLQLLEKYPELTSNSIESKARGASTQYISPKFWTYAAITWLARYRARAQWQKNQVHHWERDESSRKTSS